MLNIELIITIFGVNLLNPLAPPMGQRCTDVYYNTF